MPSYHKMSDSQNVISIEKVEKPPKSETSAPNSTLK